MKCDCHLTELEWHATSSVVPYSYVHRVDLFLAQRHVMHVFVDLGDHLPVTTFYGHNPQQRSHGISHHATFHDRTVDVERVKTLVDVYHVFAQM